MLLPARTGRWSDAHMVGPSCEMCYHSQLTTDWLWPLSVTGMEGVRARPRSWGPQPGDALSWLLWQPYELQESVSDVSRMSEEHRTYVCAEAQTEDPPPPSQAGQHHHLHPPPTGHHHHHRAAVAGGARRLPDILDSHLPPPYTTPPSQAVPPIHIPFHILPARRRWAFVERKSVCFVFSILFMFCVVLFTQGLMPE